jgi:hypothetical protein
MAIHMDLCIKQIKGENNMFRKMTILLMAIFVSCSVHLNGAESLSWNDDLKKIDNWGDISNVPGDTGEFKLEYEGKVLTIVRKKEGGNISLTKTLKIASGNTYWFFGKFKIKKTGKGTANAEIICFIQGKPSTLKTKIIEGSSWVNASMTFSVPKDAERIIFQLTPPADAESSVSMSEPMIMTAKTVNEDTVKYQKLWEQRTKGNNLALGKRVVFSKNPDYALTAAGGTDQSDLTDGKISKYTQNMIWFDKRAVGWYKPKDGAKDGVKCLIDLDQIKPVSKIVVRALAGARQEPMVSPAEFKVFISKDGNTYYEAASLVKLLDAEKDQSDFKTSYYLEENGQAYVYPFSLEVNADARYVGVFIKGATSWVILDEIAVIEGSPGTPEYNAVYADEEKRTSKFLPIWIIEVPGIVVEPRLQELAISTNIVTPNSFRISNTDASMQSTLIVDVPEGISIISPSFQKEDVQIDGAKYTRYKNQLVAIRGYPQTQMLFFDAKESANLKLPAYVWLNCDGIEREKLKFPIRLINIPEVKPKLKRLHISLGWMLEGFQMDYPEYFKAWKHLGFNAIATFPRYWCYDDGDKKAKTSEFIKAARAEGFKVIMNESPFFNMNKAKSVPEVFSKIPGGSKNLCPSYRGALYKKEMEKVSDGASLVNPDYVFWDIECWTKGAKEANECSWCLKKQKESEKTMDEYLKDLGVEQMRDLKEAVKKGTREGNHPIFTCYNVRPTFPNYQGIYDFKHLYPDYLDAAANSLYVGGNALKVHDEIRSNYLLIKKKRNIPWLSTGTYGEVSPYKVEPMVLEALMNGANGITYFAYKDFDTPREFYYHAKALAEIAPYEDLLVDGEILTDFEGSNKNLTYSAVRKGGEMLILIGNYKRDPGGETDLVLPYKKIKEIRDLRDDGKGKHIKPENPLRINIPKNQIGLYHIQGE